MNLSLVGRLKPKKEGSGDSAWSYSREVAKKQLFMVVLLLMVCSSFLWDLTTGPGDYPLSQVWATLLDKQAISIQMEVVVWDYRMPIATMALVVGVMLALAGAQMQTILNNPLADPFTLGIASAASLGAAVAIVLGQGLPVDGQYLVVANSFTFALGASLLLYGVTKLRSVTVETMILVGIALMFAFGAAVALLQYWSDETQLQQLVFWTLGSLGKATWAKIGACSAVTVACSIFFMTKVWEMTALRLGDEKARSMGVQVGRLRLQVLLAVSLLSALAVSYVGVIGFIGLVGPHIARMIVGEDQRYFLVTAALAGAFLMSLTSLISKSITPGVIYPIGIITSLIGVPFFVSLIFSVRRQNW